MNFDDAAIGGIYLIGLIIAIVQYAKGMGMSGKNLKWLSSGLGLVFGFLYQVQDGFPTDFKGWVVAVLFSIAMAVTPSGLVDAARSTVEHAVRAVAERMLESQKIKHFGSM